MADFCSIRMSRFKKRKEQEAREGEVGIAGATVTLQAGLRTLHEAGPELKRAISGTLDDTMDDCPEPMHRRNHSLFGGVWSSMRKRGGGRGGNRRRGGPGQNPLGGKLSPSNRGEGVGNHLSSMMQRELGLGGAFPTTPNNIYPGQNNPSEGGYAPVFPNKYGTSPEQAPGPPGQEQIPMRPLILNGDSEKIYQVLEKTTADFLNVHCNNSVSGQNARLAHSLPGSPADRRGNSLGVVGSAESLVCRVLAEQGLGKYCDQEFIKTTSREMQEALDMTQEEMDRAAHHLLLQERQRKQAQLQQIQQNMTGQHTPVGFGPDNGLQAPYPGSPTRQGSSPGGPL